MLNLYIYGGCKFITIEHTWQYKNKSLYKGCFSTLVEMHFLFGNHYRLLWKILYLRVFLCEAGTAAEKY